MGWSVSRVSLLIIIYLVKAFSVALLTAEEEPIPLSDYVEERMSL
jgi:hypothetical protein